MMPKFKMLVLTDHSNHSAENSLYSLMGAMRRHPSCDQLDVTTRGDELNDFFFKKRIVKDLFVQRIDKHFAFRKNGRAFNGNIRRAPIQSYDVVWLRIPPPIPEEFLMFLHREFPDQLFINDPQGIIQTGTKEFLMNFPELCPPMKICRSLEDIMELKKMYPIVLKPLRGYGGKGIIRIDGEKVWEGKEESTFEHFRKKFDGKKIEYLGVKYLENISEGDKRILVVNGDTLGASLRLPPKDSWIANVSMGGSSHFTEITPEESNIIAQVNPTISKLGIVMYGIDTLVDDQGKRVLSEINTTSVGGVPQIAKLIGKPLVAEAVDLISKYIVENLTLKNVNTTR